MPIPPAGAEILDAADPEAVAAYERAFYNAFAAIRPAGLLRHLWVWDDAAGRIAAPIPYADQVVYVLRDAAGQVRRALAVNLALRQVQAARFGFVLPEEPGIVEMLTFFADGAHDLRGALRFRQDCYADLRARGRRFGYGTARRRPLPAYGRFGTEVLEERWLEGEARYLLRFDFTQIRSRPRRIAPGAAGG
ncbi:hypothetical protein [Paracraurococcus ruber]|uniref:hypothetical protein n=1 Tax=Paracraurococcus ruber TaxID=77675 RepID=UPI0010577079|nr:hypothetical protein [Paracraurococcus ruber]TDG27585.1 hypothetical protein E2C05_22405 [Paracraurococcus ruber]